MAVRSRNPFANHPLMRKGGVHQRATSGERHRSRQQLDHLLDEWLCESETKTETEITQSTEVGEGMSKAVPSFYMVIAVIDDKCKGFGSIAV